MSASTFSCATGREVAANTAVRVTIEDQAVFHGRDSTPPVTIRARLAVEFRVRGARCLRRAPVSFGLRFLVLGGAILLSAQPAAEQASAPAAVTFTKDIAPIFQKSCLQCHQPDSIGPMSLMTYQEARPWARSIKQKVMAGEMPPYRYDRNVGIQHLKHDLRLSEKEIQTIARWVDSGAPQGNPADMPPPVTFPNPNEWGFEKQFGPPDVIVKTKPYTLSARGQDVWWRPIVPTGVDQGPLHQGRLGEAVARRAAPRRITPTPSSSSSTRRPATTSRPSASPSTRWARSARSFPSTAAARCRPTRWSAGTCTTTRLAKS